MKINILLFGLMLSGMLFFSCKDDDTNGGGNNGGGTSNVQITISDITKFEGDQNSTYEFKVRTSRESESTITVDYQTKDAAATAGEDYVAQSGTVTFSPSSREQIITIEILADTIKEADEDFIVKLTNPNNAVIDTEEGIGILRNDDTFLPNSDDGYITPSSYAGYTLMWADEFDGTSIDSDCWTHEPGNHGWGNNELQNYTSSSANSYVSDGKLTIEAIKQSSSGSDYSSARMITAGKKEFQYGRIDIRAKLPQGQGIWPALWMLGANFWDIGWPDCGEIDIMELVGHQPSTVHGTLHWDNNGSKADHGTGTTLDSGIFADEFHVFTIVWDNQNIKWYVDDEQFLTIDITPAQMTEFHAPAFFIFNIAVGGNWPGSPNNSTVFPQQMVVDYIRVFQ